MSYQEEGDEDEYYSEEEDNEEQEQQQSSSSKDFYTILKVNKRASHDEIQKAYRQLAKETHPDRAVHAAIESGSIRNEHQADILRQHCERKQQLLNEAYETLSDPAKRAQYDILGPDSKLALVPMDFFKTDTDYRSYLTNEKHAADAKRRANETGAMTQTVIEINAQNTFNPQSPLSIYNLSVDRWKSIYSDPFFKISSSSLMNVFKTRIGERNILQFRGQAQLDGTSAKSSSVHSIGLEFTHILDPKDEQTSVTVNCSYNSNLGDHVFLTQTTLKTVLDTNSSLQFSWVNAIIPLSIATEVFRTIGFITNYKRVLLNDKSLTGKLTWTYTATKSLSLLLTKELDEAQATLDITTGNDSSVTAGYYQQIAANNPQTKSGGVGLSTSVTGSVDQHFSTDCDFNVSVVKNISKSNNLGVGVGMSGSSGVSLKVSYTRERHHFEVPIQLTDYFDYRVALGAIIMPVVGFLTARKFIYRPLQRRWKRQALYDSLKKDYEQTRPKREKAQEVKETMLQEATESKLREEQIGGLVIINAQYGMLLDQEEQLTQQVIMYPPFIDVTDQLQFLVRDSALQLPEFSKAKLEGFYDPCPSCKDKSLVVTYSFRGRKHRVEIHDEEELVIPLEEDLLEDVSAENNDNNNSNGNDSDSD
jgi:DnaJ family protein C protein 11